MSGENQKQDSIAKDYIVLARKYRSQTFAELKGQDALVQTLTNAIQTNRIHHAYVLTGIRGVGKTTTARLIAKALNCENGPAVTWDETDPAVISIGKGNHVDVLEFDAASNRGVEEVQNLFEGVNYAPVQGRKKVYIIDEVHMLSRHAFNAILKTLEEPPAHVTFIFATTEVQKIPVTVLSRCQRFDLRRIPVATLQAHYTDILGKEGIKAEPEAVLAIAQAADGSARDGLSLLDQAIALSGTGEMTLKTVNGMLGLSDRTKVAEMLQSLLAGNAQDVLAKLDDLHSMGQDPLMLLHDLMHQTDTLTRLKIVPDLATSATLTELEKNTLVPLSQSIPMENLSRLYQMLLHAVSEARTAERPMEAVSMALIRISHLAALPPIGQLIQMAKAGALPDVPVSAPAPVAAAPAPQPVQEAAPAPWEGEPAEPKKPDPAPEPNVEEAIAPEPPTEIPEAPTVPATWEGLMDTFMKEQPSQATVLSHRARVSTYSEENITFSLDKTSFEREEIQTKLTTWMRQMYGQAPDIHVLEDKHENTTVKEDKDARFEAELAAAAEEPEVAHVLSLFPGAKVVDVVKKES